MVEAALHSPIDAPPAYETSQFDFDQKLAIAAERSLTLSDQRQRSEYRHEASADADGSTEETEDGYLKDKARGGDRQPQPSSNGQSPVVRPLTFRRKTRNSSEGGSSSKTKERPSWFNEAQLDASNSTSSASGRPLPVPVPVPRDTRNRERDDRSTQQQQHVIPEEPEEDRSIPPPPFVAVDNSLDGPAYERYPRNDSRRRRVVPTVMLHYTGEDQSASPPPSPPHSPVLHSSPPSLHPRHRASSHVTSLDDAYQQAPQQNRLQARTPVPRPASTGSQRYVPPPPRLQFDPSVAYEGTRSTLFGLVPAEPAQSGLDPASLYSSVVVPHLSSQKARPATTLKMKQYAPSIASLPEYDQQHHAQQTTPGIYSTQDYAASRVSVYSQSSMTHIPQYPQVAQFPSYPSTQHSHSRPMSVEVRPEDGHHGRPHGLQHGQRWSTGGVQYQTQYYQR